MADGALGNNSGGGSHTTADVAANDPNLPFHAMLTTYFVALPCPPLPILAHAYDKKTDKETTLKPRSSHDILASYLIMAMTSGTKQMHAKRRLFQIDVTRRLLDALVADPLPSPQMCFYLFQQFTADYIASFSTQPEGVMFLSVDDVKRGDNIHALTCKWSAAQDILHLPPEKRKTAEEYSDLSYQDLIVRHCYRVHGILSAGENPWLPQGEKELPMQKAIQEKIAAAAAAAAAPADEEEGNDARDKVSLHYGTPPPLADPENTTAVPSLYTRCCIPKPEEEPSSCGA